MDETLIPAEPIPTPEEIEEWEKERAEREAARLRPAQEKNAQIGSNTDVVAEHDDLIADMLYEMTMDDLGGEV